MAIEVKLQVFEGPLDLLLHLIERIKWIFTISRLRKSRSSTWSISVRWKKGI